MSAEDQAYSQAEPILTGSGRSIFDDSWIISARGRSVAMPIAEVDCTGNTTLFSRASRSYNKPRRGTLELYQCFGLDLTAFWTLADLLIMGDAVRVGFELL